MSRRTLNIIGILILMGITAVVSIFAYIYFVGGSGDVTAQLTAPTLDLSTVTPNHLETQVAELQATNAALSTAVAGAAKPTIEATIAPTSESTSEVTAEATSTSMAEATSEATAEVTVGAEAAAAVQAAAAAQAAAAGTLYRIDTAGSQVSFTLTEDLRGVPNTVVGTTDQVAGDILVDFATPSNSKIGVIRINARTLVTDQEFRNRAIRSQVLESANDKYQFIEFTPTAITDMPDKVEMGSTIKFKVTGDLKIREIVQSVTFDVSVTPTADTLTGSATTQVTRDQFNLQIPNAPGVANVSNDVTLDIKFTAPKAT